MNRLDPSLVDTIVIHTSDSQFGDIETIDKWHKENGWEMIGYHWVITNCYPTSEDFKNRDPHLFYDGAIHEGRPEEFAGAHVKGHNWHTIGICLVGKYGVYTSRQIASAAYLVIDIMDRFPTIRSIKGHEQFTQKACPQLDMEAFKDHIGLMREDPDLYSPFLVTPNSDT